MATKSNKAVAPASGENTNSALLHQSLYEGYDVAPVTKSELRTILEHFAAGISGTTTEVQ